MRVNYRKFYAAPVVLAAILAGCGGGGDSSPTSAALSLGTAEGVYSGTISDSTSTAFSMLVLENGDYWNLHGTRTGGIFNVAGLVQGSGLSSNGAFTSANARLFSSSTTTSGTVAATYNATAQTIAGTLSTTTGIVSFSGGPDTASLYNYSIPATLSNIVGAWTVTSTSGNTISLSISADGTFTAVDSGGCHFTGTVIPRASGKNVFNTTLTFGPAPCGLPNQTGTGIAVVAPLATGKHQLLFAQTDSTRTYGSAAFGTR